MSRILRHLNWMVFICLFLPISFAFADEAKPSKTEKKLYSIAVLGDSMSWIGGDNFEKPEGWTYHFNQEYQPATMTLYARSGATWSNTPNTVLNTKAFSKVLDDNNVIYNQTMRLKEDLESGKISPPELILIYAGVNDAWFEKKRPGCMKTGNLDSWENIFTTDKPSERCKLWESIALNVEILKEVSPESRILLVTPAETSKVSALKIAEVSDIIEKTGNLLGCEILRLDKLSGISHDVEKLKPTLTADGVHTNPEGAKIIAEKIISYLTL